MFKRANKSTEIVEGGRYCRSRPDSPTETARVIAVSRDPLGIPHVRFHYHVERGYDIMDEQRTLALKSFSEVFPVAVSA